MALSANMPPLQRCMAGRWISCRCRLFGTPHITPSFLYRHCLCISHHFQDYINCNQQFRNRHRKPNRICPCHSRKNVDQHPADHGASGNRNNERSHRFHQRLKIVSRKNIKRKQQERNSITANNTRSNGQDSLRWRHKNTDKEIRDKNCKRRPNHSKHRRRP